jgi:hypothetical protein
MSSAKTTANAIWPTLFLRIEERNPSMNALGVSSILRLHSSFSGCVVQSQITVNHVCRTHH